MKNNISKITKAEPEQLTTYKVFQTQDNIFYTWLFFHELQLQVTMHQSNLGKILCFLIYIHYSN